MFVGDTNPPLHCTQWTIRPRQSDIHSDFHNNTYIQSYIDLIVASLIPLRDMGRHLLTKFFSQTSGQTWKVLSLMYSLNFVTNGIYQSRFTPKSALKYIIPYCRRIPDNFKKLILLMPCNWRKFENLLNTEKRGWDACANYSLQHIIPPPLIELELICDTIIPVFRLKDSVRALSRPNTYHMTKFRHAASWRS